MFPKNYIYKKNEPKVDRKKLFLRVQAYSVVCCCLGGFILILCSIVTFVEYENRTDSVESECKYTFSEKMYGCSDSTDTTCNNGISFVHYYNISNTDICDIGYYVDGCYCYSSATSDAENADKKWHKCFISECNDEHSDYYPGTRSFIWNHPTTIMDAGFVYFIGAILCGFFMCIFWNLQRFWLMITGNCCKCRNKWKTEKEFVGRTRKEIIYKALIFVDGLYEAQYEQNNEEHTVGLFGLKFNIDAKMTDNDRYQVVGYGIDEIGEYQINGIFNSAIGPRIALRKIYSNEINQHEIRLELVSGSNTKWDGIFKQETDHNATGKWTMSLNKIVIFGDDETIQDIVTETYRNEYKHETDQYITKTGEEYNNDL